MNNSAFIVVPLGISLVITTVACRWCVAKSRKLSLSLALLGAFFTVVIMVPMAYGTDLFTARFWSQSGTTGVSGILLVPFASIVFMAIGLIPACGIVMFYRRKTQR
jgi:hypothetical protein